MLACIVFDFDGTLVQSNEIKLQTYYQVAEAVHCPREVVDAVLQAEAPGDRHQVFNSIATEMNERRLLPEGEPVDRYGGSLTERYSEICETLIARCPEVDGASEALQKLHDRGLSLILNSATPETQLKKVLGSRAFSSLISAAYGAPATKVENLNAIIKDRGCDPRDVLFVGDGDDDLQAAQRTDCHFVGVLGGRGDFNAVKVPTITNLRQLIPIVDGLSKNANITAP